MKKLGLISLITILAVLLTSCDFNNSTNSEVVNVILRITLKNQQGENLLDPNTEGHLDKSELRVLYESPNGALEEFCHGSNPRPCNLTFYDLKMAVTVYTYGRPDQSTTYLKLSETDIDTIYCEFKSGDGFYLINQAWYNGELVFTRGEDPDNIPFTITK